MPQSECMRIRMKTGMTDKFLEWAKQIPSRMEEVKVCMEEQGILAEHIFLERSAAGDFIIFYAKVQDMAKARAVLGTSQRKLDQEMLKMIDETWDRSSVVRLEPVMEL